MGNRSRGPCAVIRQGLKVVGGAPCGNRNGPPLKEAVGLQSKELPGAHPGPVPTFVEVHHDADR